MLTNPYEPPNVEPEPQPLFRWEDVRLGVPIGVAVFVVLLVGFLAFCQILNYIEYRLTARPSGALRCGDATDPPARPPRYNQGQGMRTP